MMDYSHLDEPLTPAEQRRLRIDLTYYFENVGEIYTSLDKIKEGILNDQKLYELRIQKLEAVASGLIERFPEALEPIYPNQKEK